MNLVFKKMKEKRKQIQQFKRTQELIPVQKLFHQAILTKQNILVGGLQVDSLNIELMGHDERIDVRDEFSASISSMLQNIQISVLAEPVDLSDIIEFQKKKVAQESVATRQLLRSGYIRYLEESSQQQNTLKKERYIFLAEKVNDINNEKHIYDQLDILMEKLDTLKAGLYSLSEDGFEANILNANDIIQVYQVHFNNYQARINRFKSVAPILVTTNDKEVNANV
ncbi:hypothetical protein [Bacillus sp. BS98]|uniref:hypothetical protein n=1 Tax=Bacillus sp. BS98 TaxID=2608254 RepID=UPI00209BDF20|nr:hypothetical protein [Bacillus sp. BS98]